MTRKGECFEVIQDIEATTAEPLKTLLKENFQNSSRERGQNGEVNIFKMRGSRISRINDKTSFSVMNF